MRLRKARRCSKSDNISKTANSKEKERLMKKITLLAALLFTILILSACGKEKESITTNHSRDATMERNVGDSWQMDLSLLSNIPEGHKAEEYVWSTSQIAVCDVSSSGFITAKGGGHCIAQAILELKEARYVENFDIQVHAIREIFEIEPAELVLVMDDNGLYQVEESGGHSLKLNMSEGFAFGESAVWSSSNPEIAGVTLRGKGESANVWGEAPGTADIFVTVGDQTAVAHVTVRENYVEPEEILHVLGERADGSLVTSGGTALVSTDDIGCSLVPEGPAGGGGKYLVKVDLDIPNGYASSRDLGMITGLKNVTEHLSNGIGFTSLLPEKMRPETMEDVSYIILVSEGEREKNASYTNNVQGWVRVVNIQLIDALTGDVLETYATKTGRLKDQYWVMEDATDVVSDLPEANGVISALYQIIADFWLDDYENVVFYDHTGKGTSRFGGPAPRGIMTYRYYGSGVVVFPEELGFTEMNCKDMGPDGMDTEFAGFELRSEAEIDEWSGWKNFEFRVLPDSEAEKYCQNHEIRYEVINE